MCKKTIFLAATVLYLGLAVTASADLIALYKFDTDFSDTAGHPTGPFHATVSNGTPEVNADGKLVLISSEQDVISCGTIVGSAPDLSFAMWLNVSRSTGTDMRLMGKNDMDSSTPGWNVMVRTGTDADALDIRPQFEGHGGSNWGNSILMEDAYVVGQWVHFACTWDSSTETFKGYIDGTLVVTAVIAGADVANTANELYLGRSGFGNTEWFDGMVDDFAIWDHVLTDEDVLDVYTLGPLALDPRQAGKPSPDDEATDVPRDVILNWMPGLFAPAVNGHIVYLSESFNDVNDGLGGITQSADSYAPAQRLDFEKTYYWRVDEVNAPPDSTVFEGRVWSFTTEPVGYPIAGENITATASSSNNTDTVLENTINGTDSGLDENDLHSDDDKDMWLSNMNGPQPTWIQYEFDKVYKLHEMWVWNHNTSLEPVVGFGIREAVIEYSTDGTNWTTLGTTHEFNQAPGGAGYAHNTTVNLNGVSAKHVRLTANSNWNLGGWITQYGLSEVRFFYIPVWAREPSPASGAQDVDVDSTLVWRAGREADRHDVYFSSDEQAVIDGTADVVTVTEPGYTPSLDLASTYYWRIDEANDAETPAIWQGDILNFTTQEFIVVDDFESYNDIPAGEDDSNLVYDTWVDGYANPNINGSTMGYVSGASMETDNVHGGNQSVPFQYNNTTAGVSEATLNLTPAQDWTAHGVITLSLWFAGDSANVPGQLYVKINGVQVNYDGEASNLTLSGWQPWNIDLTSVGVNLSSVTSLAIGIQGPGATGILLLDDISLYSYSRQLVTPVEPDPANLVAHWSLDEGAGITTTDEVGGKAANVINATWTAGLFSNSKSALEFNGSNTYVDVVGQDWGTFNQVSIAVWLKFDSLPGPYNSIFHEDWAAGGIHFMVRGSGVVGFSLNGRGPNDYNSQAVLEAGETYHVVATFDIATGHTQIYINGVLDSEETSSPTASAIFLRSPFTIGSWNTGRYWDGVLDDLRIYNHIVTDEELAWLAGRTQPFDKPF